MQRILFLCFALFQGQLLQASDGKISEAERNGLLVYQIENEFWQLEVVPALGGKLISLIDRKTGREWLWSREESRQLTAPDPGNGFGMENLLGMDEILPSLREETVDGFSLPGHGEIWRSSLAVDEELLLDGKVTTRLQLDSLPLQYSRTISLDGPSIRLEYGLTNLSSRRIPFLWALHPLFVVQTGDRLEMDLDVLDLEVKAGPGLPEIGRGDRFDWPGDSEGIDLESLFLRDDSPAGIKFFAQSPPDGTVRLTNPQSGSRLKIHYDTKALPWLAIWLSRGVWGGAHHIAIEPTNRPGESIGMSGAEQPLSGMIGAGSTHHWWLELVNESTDES